MSDYTLSDTTRAILELLRSNVPEAMRDQMVLPPPILTELQAEFIEFDREAQMLTARFPVQEKHYNPLYYLQGGILAAMIDNTMGPLSFLVAPPNVTTQFNTSYIRPVTASEAFVVVTARVTERTRRMLFIEGRAATVDDRTLALSYATHQILER